MNCNNKNSKSNKNKKNEGKIKYISAIEASLVSFCRHNGIHMRSDDGMMTKRIRKCSVHSAFDVYIKQRRLLNNNKLFVPSSSFPRWVRICRNNGNNDNGNAYMYLGIFIFIFSFISIHISFCLERLRRCNERVALIRTVEVGEEGLRVCGGYTD